MKKLLQLGTIPEGSARALHCMWPSNFFRAGDHRSRLVNTMR